ncbi:3-carboxy-cis,cis-muconate cycloisomerase [Deinococcus deserti]|uniref:Putative 3-carboxy-cis,cis-muconate cycloisomerase (3-carboxymuconate lactonizing enzyme) n=1 Tax=Deinococcus deserti (strain DSM 17065 / CIP 109153 / LMG 22923 / VCD115) TaxID=546414 RepID=C1D2D5_DEIDV|nr:3-carboxy-cis,cis-muconate cycloisomerase [Deinococcus deserti]ACO47574.1 putative 3-carboxy-cis,cis-muconate cycloisomerase (3-carboxymuconate lactonizing enzyme) [Deinococcus deserti VCD115]
MSFTPLDSSLYGSLFTSPAMRQVFSDQQHLQRLVDVEVALAQAQATLGLIPPGAAQDIEAAGRTFQPDLPRLQEGLANDGFPIIALLAQLREHLPEDAAGALHFGATTQDILDTALVLQLREALNLMDASLHLLVQLLAHLADQHRRTLMAGRTHSQQALPISFGLKVTGWLAPLLRHQARLGELRPRLLVVQFGGAAGTLAALDQQGPAVAAELARILRLEEPLMPWHTQRDTLAELGSWLSLVTGSLGKMAQDIILMAQSEVAEVRESSDPARGGSSTMPQKSNPIQSELIVAAARANATLLTGLHQALVQEHERATHGWQLEWLTLPQMLGLTAGALDRAVVLAQELEIDAARMRENVATSQGLMMAEAYVFALTPLLGRKAAKDLVRDAVAVTLAGGGALGDSLQTLTDAPIDWNALREDQYLGANDALIDRVLHQVDQPARSHR